MDLVEDFMNQLRAHSAYCTLDVFHPEKHTRSRKILRMNEFILQKPEVEKEITSYFVSNVRMFGMPVLGFPFVFLDVPCEHAI